MNPTHIGKDRCRQGRRKFSKGKQFSQPRQKTAAVRYDENGQPTISLWQGALIFCSLLWAMQSEDRKSELKTALITGMVFTLIGFIACLGLEGHQNTKQEGLTLPKHLVHYTVGFGVAGAAIGYHLKKSLNERAREIGYYI